MCSGGSVVLPRLGRRTGVENVPALLAALAVIGYMAKTGLPWWAVVAVVVLTGGLVGMQRVVTGQPVRSSSADKWSAVVPVCVKQPVCVEPADQMSWQVDPEDAGDPVLIP